MKFRVAMEVEMTAEQVKAYAEAETCGDVSRVAADVAEWVAEAVEVSNLGTSGLVSFTSIREG